MSECTCHKNYTLDTLIPKVGVITDIRQETPDVKTFRVNAPEGGKLFEHMPGQCAMVCAPGVSAVSYTHLDVYKRQPFLFMSQNSILQRRQRSFDCYELKQKWKKVLLFQKKALFFRFLKRKSDYE